MKRTKLKHLQGNKFYAFTGKVEKINNQRILVVDVFSMADHKSVSDHAWITLRKWEFEKIRPWLKKGIVIQFSSNVKKYNKGYKLEDYNYGFSNTKNVKKPSQEVKDTFYGDYLDISNNGILAKLLVNSK